MTQIIGIVYIIAMGVFFIAFLVTWFRSRKEVRGYKKYGILAGIILIGFEVFGVLLVGLDYWPPLILISLIIGDGIAFFRIMAYTIVGIHMSTQLGYHSFPLLKSLMGRSETDTPEEPDGQLWSTSQSQEAGKIQSYSGTLSSGGLENPDAIYQTAEVIPKLPDPPEFDSSTYILKNIVVVISAVVYSVILFSLTSPEMSDFATQKFGGDVPIADNIQLLIGLLVGLEFAFIEEIVFRLGIQNFLAKVFNWRDKKYWNAILLSSILWTIAHTGVLEPNWVKLAQVFPFGLALGWLYKQQGTESCIFTHAFFNVVMTGISPLL